MSQRVLLEINTDHLHALKWDTEFWTNLLANLGSSHYSAELNAANEAGHPVDIGHGVRIVLQRHHSTDATVKTDYVEVKL